MLSVSFEDLTRDMKTIGLDVFETKYPKIKIDGALGEQLRQHFFAMQMVGVGLPVSDALAKAKETSFFGFAEQNTGRMFNFWHFLYDLMRKNSKAKYPRKGKCVIKRDMVDPNEPEDLIQVFCYPYVAKGGKFAAPVINKVLDFYGVDKLEITETFGR